MIYDKISRYHLCQYLMSWILMIGLCQVAEQLNSSIVERFYLGWNGQSRLNKAVTCYILETLRKMGSIESCPVGAKHCDPYLIISFGIS